MTIQFPEAGAWPNGADPNAAYHLVYETPPPEGVKPGDAVAFQNSIWLGEYTTSATWKGRFRNQAKDVLSIILPDFQNRKRKKTPDSIAESLLAYW